MVTLTAIAMKQVRTPCEECWISDVNVDDELRRTLLISWSDDEMMHSAVYMAIVYTVHVYVFALVNSTCQMSDRASLPQRNPLHYAVITSACVCVF